jgi:FtsZ-interacting cell division protein ZipA
MLTPQKFRLIGATVMSILLLVLAGAVGGTTVAARDRDERRYEDRDYKSKRFRSRSSRSSYRRIRYDDDDKKHCRYQKKWKKSKKHKKHDRYHDDD